MKFILALSILLCTVTAFAQTGGSGQITLSQWNEDAKNNIRLLPEYGHGVKTEEQKKADMDFIESAMKQFPTARKASDHLISLGFDYLYKDVKTAMYRFNQAYLLDPSNTDIYWGYGAVYMVLVDYPRARQQYLKGLALNPKNTHLLTDYGTYFMSQFFTIQYEQARIKEATGDLDSAVVYMNRSYRLDAKDPNTTYKLSVCYLYKSDCTHAWKFYNECKALGGQPITDDYTSTLTQLCAKKK